MYSTQDFRKNLKFEIDGEPFVILEAQHVKPGKGVAFVKTKYRSLVSGRVLEKNFRSGDKVEKANIESRTMQYSYIDGPHYVFMDTTTFEMVRLEQESVADVKDLLKDNLEVEILFHNHKAISIELPNFVVVTVTKTDPGVKGDTAQGGTKPATVETGATVMVPLYLSEGEKIKIDTRTREFVERVNS